MVGQPSIIGGTAIIAGTAIGAGMFSLPVASAGMGFCWALLCLTVTAFFMLHSALMILEINLHYPPGASFDTFIGGTLGPRWNALNNLMLVFVLYILSYAFISGGGSSVSQALHSLFDFELAPVISGLLFSSAIALIVWIGTRTVSRIMAVIIAGMVLSFAWSIAQLFAGITPALLLDVKPGYLVYTFAALPIYLAAFGYHGNVPSLVEYYGKNPVKVSKCLIFGTLLSLLVYIVWQAVTLGQIPREEFTQIIAKGGNIGHMVAAISNHQKTGIVMGLLNTFANLAVISSFLGGSLGLFSFIADKFGFADDHLGRLKSLALTFLPPTVASMFFPNGFIIAIGYAGLAATVFVIIIPATAVKASRKNLGNPLFRVWGGDSLIYLMYAYGVLIAGCHLLASFGSLPVYGR